MLARNLALMALVVTICALAGRFQSPEAPEPGEESRPPVFAYPVIGKTWVLEHLQGRLQIRVKGKPDGVVWSELERNPNWCWWSEDGTHLAMFQGGSDFLLRVWTAKSLNSYRGEFLNSEGPFEVAFSPDNRFLLLRVARVQGMFDVDLGQLYSLDLYTGQTVYWEEVVRKFSWLDPFHFRCWVAGGKKGADSSRWRLVVREYDLSKPPDPPRSPPVLR